MGLLDTDRVCAALGTRLGERFLQYATRAESGELGHLLIRIDEHVAAARGDDGLAGRIAVACKQLLIRTGDLEPEAARAVMAAVRYFVDTYDLARDDAPRGYVDDVQVVNYVLSNVAPDLPPVTA